MNNRKLMEKVNAVLRNFLDKDRNLLMLNASERSISHKLAEHLGKEFPDGDADYEYNRWGDRPKTLPEVLFNDITDYDQDARAIFSDIIVYKRQLPDNLLVIEVKKSSSRENNDKDRIKLIAFTDPEGDYRYKVGLFIVFDVENQKVDKVRCFENGDEVECNGVMANLEALGHGL